MTHDRGRCLCKAWDEAEAEIARLCTDVSEARREIARLRDAVQQMFDLAPVMRADVHGVTPGLLDPQLQLKRIREIGYATLTKKCAVCGKPQEHHRETHLFREAKE